MATFANNLVFLSPGDAVRPIALNFAWTERHCHACKTPRSMYPSIYNCFPVIRTTIAKKSPFLRAPTFIFFVWPGAPLWFPVIRTASAKNRRFHVPQPTFLFSLETPLRLSRNMLHEWKDNLMLAKPLAACTHLSSTVSKLFEPQVQKNSPFSCTAAHIFVSPGDAPAIITQYVAWMER